MQTYPLRPRVALQTSLPMPAAFALLSVLMLRPWVLTLAGLAVATLVCLLGYRRARRRYLQVDDQGLTVQRDTFRLHADWDQVAGVGKDGGLIPLEVLELSGSTVEALDAQGRGTRLPAKIEGHPATRKIQIEAYLPHWREEIGSQRLPHLL